MTGGQPDCQETNDDKSVGQAPFFPEEHFKFLHSLNLQRSRITLPLVLVCIKEMEYLSVLLYHLCLFRNGSLPMIVRVPRKCLDCSGIHFPLEIHTCHFCLISSSFLNHLVFSVCRLLPRSHPAFRPETRAFHPDNCGFGS